MVSFPKTFVFYIDLCVEPPNKAGLVKTYVFCPSYINIGTFKISSHVKVYYKDLRGKVMWDGFIKKFMCLVF